MLHRETRKGRAPRHPTSDAGPSTTRGLTTAGGLTLVRRLALVGVIVAIVWGFLGYRMLQDRLASLARTPVPGQVTIHTDGPQRVTLFYEDPTAPGGFVVRAGDSGTPASAPIDIAVTDQAGRSAATTPYGRDLRFTHRGRTVIALATLDVPAAGSYTIRAGGDVATGAGIAVGTVVDAGMLINGIGAVVVFVLGILALAVVIIAPRITSGRAT